MQPFLAVLLLAWFGQATPAPESLVRTFVDAFNAHDVARMLSMATPDIKWMILEGGQLSVETSDAKQLETSMQKYFRSLPSAKSVLRNVTSSGPFVTTLEEAQWEAGGERKHQCAVAVYQITEGKIANVWYFAAHRC